MTIFLAIFNHLSMMLAAGVIAGFVEYSLKRDRVRRLLAAVVLGSGALVGMLNPVTIAPGLIFDGRSILISLAALYFGPVEGLIAALPVAALRLVQGGVGVRMGIPVIAASFAIGAIARWRRGDRRAPVPVLRLWAFGLAVHAAMLLLAFSLPFDRALATLREIGLPVIILYPLAGMAVGRILNIAIIQRRTVEDLRRSEQRIRLISDNLPHGMIYQVVADLEGNRRFTYVSESCRALYGAGPAEILADPGKIYGRIHPDDVDRLAEEEAAALREQATFKTEVRVVEPSGAVRWSYFVSAPRRQPDGSVHWDGIEFVITERKAAEEALAQALSEKETLLRELYHRTKNTLEVVRSLLRLQADDHPDDSPLQAAVRITDERIQAISLVHQMLYKGQDLSRVPIRAYIHDLAELLLDGYVETAGGIAIEYAVDEIRLPLEAAIPLGLVVNELLTNSFKYAFPDGRPGKVRLSLRCRGDSRIELEYRDDGAGFPDGFDPRDQPSLGLKLIYSIGEHQLAGKVEFLDGTGAGFRLDFPADRYGACV